MASGDTLGGFMPRANQPPTTNYATPDERNNHPVLDFDDTTNEDAIFAGILDRAYGAGGVTVVLKVSLSSATTGDTDWDVSWERVGDEVQDIDSDGFAAVNSSDNNTVPATSGDVQDITITFTEGADMDSVAAGEAYRLKVTRDAASDTAVGDAELWGVEIRET